MVVHDETRLQAWTQAREEQQKKEKQKPIPLLSVVAVQSVACVALVLTALLLRLVGGDAYAAVRDRFHRALAKNEWVSALVLAWDGSPLERAEEDAESPPESGVKEEGFTPDEPAPLSDASAAVAATAPLESGTLTSGYGERLHPIDGAEEFHTGVDIAAPQGTPLRAVYDGEVTEVGEDARLGRYVRLRHGSGIEIVYGHCEEVTAEQGDAVTAGQTVALVGSTGVSTGNHVHIRLYLDGVTCDPAVLLPLEQYV